MSNKKDLKDIRPTWRGIRISNRAEDLMRRRTKLHESELTIKYIV
jgi:hypothetical protein